MKFILMEEEEFKTLLRQAIRAELRAAEEEDEIGGVEFAAKLTGYKPVTIYQKVRKREIPFKQDAKGCKVTFSRNALLKWKRNQK